MASDAPSGCWPAICTLPGMERFLSARSSLTENQLFEEEGEATHTVEDALQLPERRWCEDMNANGLVNNSGLVSNLLLCQKSTSNVRVFEI